MPWQPAAMASCPRPARRGLPCRRPGGMERARRALLTLRLRDRDAGVPALRARRRGRLPGRVREDLRAPRFAPRRRCDPALDRPADAQLLPRPAASSGQLDLVEEPEEPVADEVIANARRCDDRAGRPRPARRRVPGGPRPVLLPRRELPHDRSRLGIPAGTIASRISRCLAHLRFELEGRNPASTHVQWSGDRMTTFNEEQLGELLRLLPPAPAGWVAAAQELPRARVAARRARRAGRSGRCLPRRARGRPRGSAPRHRGRAEPAVVEHLRQRLSP